LENLNTGITLLGAPFLATCDCGMSGTTLVFRGNLGVSGGPGGGFRVFDLPAAIAAPPVIRRLNVQAASIDNVGLNINTDRTVTLAAGAPGAFLILDGCSIPGWT
jgi:hypothetical protein